MVQAKYKRETDDGFGYVRPLMIDISTGALKTNTDHLAYLHRGQVFTATDSVDLSASQKYRWSISTPDTMKFAHFKFKFHTEDEINVKFIENPSTLTNGASWTAYNRNRNSKNDSKCTLLKSHPAYSGGTTIWTIHMSSDYSAGYEGGGENEWVLKRNTDYVLEIEDISAGANYVAVEFSWAEIEDYEKEFHSSSSSSLSSSSSSTKP